MKILINISLLFMCLLFAGCNKKVEKYYVQNTFKEWSLFQQGSYWLYLNEISGKTDSSYLYSFTSTWFYQPIAEDNLYEMISYRIPNIGEFRVGARSDYSFFSVQGIFPHGIYILTSWVTSHSSDQVSPTCWVVKRYDSLIVNNQLFFDVIHTRDTFSNSINDYYVAKKIGLIKFAVKYEHSDSTWSLLRYHIEQ